MRHGGARGVESRIGLQRAADAGKLAPAAFVSETDIVSA